jgi:hypothetical protein
MTPNKLVLYIYRENYGLFSRPTNYREGKGGNFQKKNKNHP